MQTVRITAPGPSGDGTKISDAATGAPIHGVAAADISLRRDAANVAVLQILCVSAEIEGRAEYTAIDPRDGTAKKISRIVFADGSEFVPE